MVSHRRLRKDIAVTISVLITHVINLSITSQCIPHDWKHAKVIPLFNDGVRGDIDNLSSDFNFACGVKDS